MSSWVKNEFLEKFIIYYLLRFFVILLFPIAGVVKIFLVSYSALVNYFAPVYTVEKHARKVKIVQDQVLSWNRNGRPNKMCTGRPAWLSIAYRTPTYKSSMTKININMGEIVKIDTTNQTVIVEPLVSMGKLTEQLIKLGWIIPVVPELNELTVGGLICGAGLETSSHKFGLFYNICTSFEIVLANGEVVNCSQQENSDLFHAIPGSYGTLGFVTSVTMKIIPAKKYMELEYIPARTLDEAVEVFKSKTLAESGNDYVEGIMFGIDHGVVMVGNMTNEPNSAKGQINSIGRWYKPWFYKHVENFLKNSSSSTKSKFEYIPLRDYFHRHSKCVFWESWILTPWGNNVIFRYLLGWVLPLPMFFVLSFPDFGVLKSIMDSFHFLQDYVIPLDKLKDLLIFSHEQTNIYPIWLCPAKIYNTPGMFNPGTGQDEIHVDVGIYGLSHVKGFDLVKTAKKFEEFCLKNRGFQGLYADVFLTRAQFEIMFNHELYFKMRKELCCEDAFPEIYDKVSRSARSTY